MRGLRFLVELAAKRAGRIESAVRSVGLADHRRALSAGGTASDSVRAPSRVAFRFARGLSGWARSPVAEARYDDGTPDADEIDPGFDDEQVSLADGPLDEGSIAPLSE